MRGVSVLLFQNAGCWQGLGPPAGPGVTEAEATLLFGHKKHRGQAGEECASIQPKFQVFKDLRKGRVRAFQVVLSPDNDTVIE